MSQLSPQAAQYYHILTSFSDAIVSYEQRICPTPGGNKGFAVERIIPLSRATEEFPQINSHDDHTTPNLRDHWVGAQGNTPKMGQADIPQDSEAVGELQLNDSFLNPGWNDVMSILEMFTHEFQD